MARLRNVQDQIIINLVSNTLFPSFEDICDILSCRDDLSAPLLLNSKRLEIRYSLPIHECCKLIFESPLNNETMVEYGKHIYEKGGLTGLRTSFNIIIHLWRGFGSLRLSNNFKSVTSDW